MDNTEEGASTSDVPDVSTAPYDVMDKVETSTMRFEHQSRNGDRWRLIAAPDAHIGDRNMNIPFSGGCACGAVRYTGVREPIAMINCHCRDCQLSSGAPFASGIIVMTADL
jgi:hypothetical protein